MKGKGNGNKGMIEDGRELREEKKGMRSKYNREKRGRKVRSGKEKRRKGGGKGREFLLHNNRQSGRLR